MKKSLFLFIVPLVIFSIFSCCNSYEQMIESFNDKYFKPDYLSPEEYTTENKDFKESSMLDEVFYFPEGYLIILEAPKGRGKCTYEWKAIIPSTDNSNKEILKEDVIGTDRTLKFKTPGVFNTDKENKLILTVTESSGNIYKDTANVFITK